MVEAVEPKNIIPIGSIEFVQKFLSIHYLKIAYPRNVPVKLFNFAGRSIVNGYSSDVSEGDFIKSYNTFKNSWNGYVDKYIKENLPKNHKWQISEYIDNIESEWRVFIYKGEIVGMHNYLGDCTLFPDVVVIRQMINYFKHSPIAYTLDVGIKKKEGDSGYITFLLEVHDFFSIGLYGFNDLDKIASMFKNWFIEFVGKVEFKNK